MLEQALHRRLAELHGGNAQESKTLLAYLGLATLQQQKKEDCSLLDLQKMAADLLEAEAVRKIQGKFTAQKRRSGSTLTLETPIAPKVTEVQPPVVVPPQPAPEQFHRSTVKQLLQFSPLPPRSPNRTPRKTIGASERSAMTRTTQSKQSVAPPSSTSLQKNQSRISSQRWRKAESKIRAEVTRDRQSFAQRSSASFALVETSHSNVLSQTDRSSRVEANDSKMIIKEYLDHNPTKCPAPTPLQIAEALLASPIVKRLFFQGTEPLLLGDSRSFSNAFGGDEPRPSSSSISSSFFEHTAR